jgi:hypothetical protein
MKVSVNPDLGRRVGGDVEIGTSPLDHGLEQVVE